MSWCHRFISCLCLWSTRPRVLLKILYVYSWAMYTLHYPSTAVPRTQISLFILYDVQLSEKHTLSFMLKKHFLAFPLNQASVTLCSPFLTQTADVQLQVCRIQRHLLYFSRSGYCSWDESVRGLAAPSSARIDNA